MLDLEAPLCVYLAVAEAEESNWEAIQEAAITEAIRHENHG